ncbi:MAG: phosphotransferase [Puniceicoccales bacterium]|jgi:aminoglycoside/choline kinase family phosphotransferase|nr:phosphotransferase [Puniceicoccales bacterium]
MKLSPADFALCTPVEKGGSGRLFYRVGLPGDSRGILCCYDNSREENALYVPLARFLAKFGFPVPKVLDSIHNADGTGALLMEDAGADDLWSLRNADWPIRRSAYQSALRALYHLHMGGYFAWVPSNTKLMPKFDEALYGWERNYFLENAVGRYLGIELTSVEASALQQELGELAVRLQALPPQLVHRDCQSQNILWKDGAICFIDFQGMRVGTGFYDLGSLLWDPYVQFPPTERTELLDFYWNLGIPNMNQDVFGATFLDASAQRLMQALGAYGFLGIVKNRQDFLAHFPPALENLFAITRSNSSLPHLHQLTVRMRDKMQSLS